ncbi:MAG TPA: hypothetical protein DDY70_00935, partial [Clostridiales bacterium]|nr:hypothetical protein [Clostridiales bacterium]
MKKKNIFSLLGFCAVLLVFSLLAVFLPAAEVRGVDTAPSQDTTYDIQVDYDRENQVPIMKTYTATTVKVTDLLRVRRLSAYNYEPDEYAEIESNAISNEHNGEPLASRGTIRYVITNIEGISPANGAWNEALAPYAEYIGDDERLHLTLYLPPMLSACHVFVRVQHAASMGTLTGYDSVRYATTDKDLAYDASVRHADGTEGVYLDIPLIVSQRFWNENPIQNGCVVTIHYEAEEGRRVGFVGTPIIGPDKEVRAMVERGNTFRLVAVFLAVLTFFIFVFVCVLKRAGAFVPELVFAVAVMIGVYASLSLSRATELPYLWLAVRGAAVGVFLLGASLTLPRRAGNFPVRRIALLFSLLTIGFAFSVPLVNTAGTEMLTLAYRIAGSVAAGLVLVFTAR